ncbi:MAG: smalltalk protein [Prevotella sp.]|nr:smalltalk protein [Prevotella sp.]
MKRETWKMVIQPVVSILTAIATTLGVTSCM